MKPPRQPRRPPGSSVLVWAARHLQSLVSSLGMLSRRPLGSLMVASVVGLALALPFGLYLILATVDELGGRWDGGSEVALFLRPTLSDDDARRLAAALDRRADVRVTRVITKDEGLEEFRRASGLDGVLRSFGADNPLPAVVRLEPMTSDSSQLERLGETLGALPEVEFVQLDIEWLRRLHALLELLRRLVWMLSALLAVGVVLVVGNTLRMSIEARREEIEIAKLFGASDGFVRRPFLYHGALYGLLGAMVATLLVVLCRGALAGPLLELGRVYGAAVPVAGPTLRQVASLVGAGAGLGLLGAWATVSRELRGLEPR